MSIDDLEKKFTEFADDLEKRFEEFTQRVEDRFKGVKDEPEKPKELPKPPKRGQEPAFWGIVLVIIGAILLGNHFRWFYLDIPWIPAGLVVLGAYLIFENRQR